ncbi:MAG: outer membrane lipoprotein carrier protein LolA [Xanthomonadales bacterium]|nr:outer membrane lipoprotein carrier protein LolA [Xanthomonadales bacterium]
MHTWLKIIACWFLGMWSALAAAEQTSLIEYLHQAYAKVQYFEADFTQEKHIKFLSKPLISKGKIKFVKQQGMIWEITSPIWVKTKIQDNQIFKTTDYENNKKVTDVQMKAVAQILTELLSSQLDRVESQFDVADLEHDEAQGQWQVKLMPKSMMIKKALQELVIFGQLSDDAEKQGISQIKIVDQSGNHTKIQFESVRIKTDALTQDLLDAFQ